MTETVIDTLGFVYWIGQTRHQKIRHFTPITDRVSGKLLTQ